MSDMVSRFCEFIRTKVPGNEIVQLHQPEFNEIDKQRVVEAIDSTFVSSVGPCVDEFENRIRDITGAAHAIAVVNGTAGLHVALHASGVGPGDLVICQSLSFVATCNAVLMTGAKPVLLDIDRSTLGLSAEALQTWLQSTCVIQDGRVIHQSGKRVAAVVPMHSFGHPVDLLSIQQITNQWGLVLIEDAAEALGSQYRHKTIGCDTTLGVFSFNGNKTVTTGGGGVVVTSSDDLARRLKSLTTTAKIPHRYEFNHDEPAFNYRLPNLNAALGCAQLAQLSDRLSQKRKLAKQYQSLFKNSDWHFVDQPENTRSNFWLNCVLCPSESERDRLLDTANLAGIAVRPAWRPMHKVGFLQSCEKDACSMTDWVYSRLVSLPSSAFLGAIDD